MANGSEKGASRRGDAHLALAMVRPRAASAGVCEEGNVMSDEGAEPEDETDDVDVIETITTAVGDDGTVLVDDLVAVVDPDGALIATDETITVEGPDGTVVVDEVVSVADKEGNLVPVAEQAEIDAPSDAALGALIGEAGRRGLGPRALVLAAVAIAGLVALIMLIRRRR
jgi:hypothetical protein